MSTDPLVMANNKRGVRPKRGQFVSSHQKRYLMHLLESYPKLKDPVHFNPSLRKIWSDATPELNELPGPKKSTPQWRRTLHDLLYRAMKKKKKESESSINEYENINYLFVERYDDLKVARCTSQVEKEYRHALLLGGDPNLSNTASWMDSPSQYDFDTSTLFEEDETDENIDARNDSVGREQMAIIACSHDDICVQAKSVTPPSFLEEIVMYALNQRDIIAW